MKLPTLIFLVLFVGVAFYLWQESGDDDSDDSGDGDGGTVGDASNGLGEGGAMQYTGTIVQKEEGDNLTAYPDADGYSIGYGHHSSDVTAGETETQAQADADFQSDIASAVAFVNNHVHITLTQDQFNGLVDFVYNVGTGTALKGTVFALVNAGDFDGVASKLEEYVYSGGQKLASLLPRRIAEAAGFEE